MFAVYQLYLLVFRKGNLPIERKPEGGSAACKLCDRKSHYCFHKLCQIETKTALQTGTIRTGPPRNAPQRKAGDGQWPLGPLERLVDRPCSAVGVLCGHTPTRHARAAEVHSL